MLLEWNSGHKLAASPLSFPPFNRVNERKLGGGGGEQGKLRDGSRGESSRVVVAYVLSINLAAKTM